MDERFDIGCARVDEVHEQVGVDDLFQRRTESLDQLVRQPAHESDGVGEHDGLTAGEVQPPHGGVEGGEELVLDEDARVREPVEQGRLARVRVADERDMRDVATLARLALGRARRRQPDQVTFELLHAPQQAPAIDFELGLTRTARADTRTLLAQLEAATPQAGQPIAQLRELDLHRTLLARRVLGEDVEDQRDAVDDVDREQILEVALLGGRQLVVEDHDVDVERLADRLQLLGLALADVGRRVGRAPALQLGVDGLGAGRVGEQRQLGRATLRLLRRCRCRTSCRSAARAGGPDRDRPRSR